MWNYQKLFITFLFLFTNLVSPIFAGNSNEILQPTLKSSEANGDNSSCPAVSLDDAIDFVIFISNKIAFESSYLNMLNIECTEGTPNPLMLARIDFIKTPEYIAECHWFLEAPEMPDLHQMSLLRLPLYRPGEGTSDGGSSTALLDPLSGRFWILEIEGFTGKNSFILTGVLPESLVGDLTVLSDNMEIFNEASQRIASGAGGVRDGAPWRQVNPNGFKQCKSDIVVPLKKSH